MAIRLDDLTRFLDANRSPTPDQVRGHAALENALCRRIYRAAVATASAGCRRDPRAASIARIKSSGRNGFCRQTTSENSGVSDRKSSAVIPEIAMTDRL